MNLRGRKGVESKARPSCSLQSQFTRSQSQFAVRSRSLQYTVAVRKSQFMQVDAVASQMLTLRGNECLNFIEVRRGLYTRVYDYLTSDSEHVRDNLLDFPTSSCLCRTLPYGLQRIGTWGCANESTSDVSPKGTSHCRTALIRIFGKSQWSGASRPDGEVAISNVDWL